MRNRILCVTLGVVWLSLLSDTASASDKNTGAKAALTFEKDVRPILKAYCFECHGEGKRLRGELDLRLVRLARKGGETGPALIPGKLVKSLLARRIRAKEMPPGKVKLDQDQIGLIERWIAQGAKTARPEPKKIAKGVYVTPEERNFWAFQPIRRPPVPKLAAGKPIRNAIDAFLLAKLGQDSLTYSPPADNVTLIRRAYFNLTGLPPAPADVQSFLRDGDADAYEKRIDRLLASPHYGEHWGRHWLDVAGYADSEGHGNEDPVRPYAWKYRDYVIRSFNADRPFDEFIREQIAGDELALHAEPSPAIQEKLIATGFLRMAADGTAARGGNTPAVRNQVIADTLEIVSTSLLGLTVGCARCHNHKYDPITQEDYYRLRAVFEPAFDWRKWRVPATRRVVLFSAADRKRAAAIEARARKIDAERLKKQAQYVDQIFERELAKVPAKLRAEARKAKETAAAKRTAGQKQLLLKYPRIDIRVGQLRLYDRKAAAELQMYVVRASKIRQTKPKPDYIRALTEKPGRIPPTFLFHRGEIEAPRQRLQPQGLAILASLKLGALTVNDKALPTSGRRLSYAKRLTSGKHPLVARVIVNRIWRHHFGRGIVATTGDLGFLGERPSHPQLLDWLAAEFMAGGWKVKRLHKLIMTSQAYRQSSQRTAQLQKFDPDNRLIGRMPLRRLQAESIRDAILSVSGKLNKKRYGPPVPVRVTKSGAVVLGVDTRDGAGRFTGKVVSLGGSEYRRSVYVQVRRSQPLGVLETFDAPVMNPNCHKRNSSTVAPQALFLMNSEFILRFADFFATRVEKEAGNKLAQQIKRAWQLAYSAEPSPLEMRSAIRFLQAQATDLEGNGSKQPAARQRALANFCQALITSNRFLYLD